VTSPTGPTGVLSRGPGRAAQLKADDSARRDRCRVIAGGGSRGKSGALRDEQYEVRVLVEKRKVGGYRPILWKN